MCHPSVIFIYMMRDIIKYTLQIVISVLVAMEVSIPPNDYVRHLIVVLILYICFKNKVDERILSWFDKYF